MLMPNKMRLNLNLLLDRSPNLTQIKRNFNATKELSGWSVATALPSNIPLEVFDNVFCEFLLNVKIKLQKEIYYEKRQIIFRDSKCFQGA